MSVHDAPVLDDDLTEPDAEARRSALTVVLAGLLRGSAGVPLVALFELFEEADGDEVASAAGAVLTIYLRSGTETRRRLRGDLAAATGAAGRTRLARALVGRVGAVAGAVAGGGPP